MFVPFQRLGDTDNTTGVGLGLALSRGLTEAMGGTLEPEETPGGGLTMMSHAGRGGRASDRTRPEPGGPEPGVPGTSRRRMTRVLVVDDEPQILRALRINLRVRNYEVDTAATGSEALDGRRPAPARPGVLDLGLPDLDGVRGHRGAARLDPGPDHRAVRPGRQHRQGRGAGRRARTTT